MSIITHIYDRLFFFGFFILKLKIKPGRGWIAQGIEMQQRTFTWRLPTEI